MENLQHKPKAYTPDPVTGLYHFKLEDGTTFAIRKPKLSDLKRAAQLAGTTSGSETYDSLLMNEQLCLLLLAQVNEKPINYEQALAAGGLEGLFSELCVIEEVIRVTAVLKGKSSSVPLGQTS